MISKLCKITFPAAGAALLLAACSPVAPLATVEYVDLERFMGDWYVIANIPTRIETDAYNAVESYRLDEDGSIATTFTFLDGGFEGRKKEYNPRGFINDRQSNAVWGMQFIWPIKADYRVVYLDDDYSVTIIGRNKRDYVWLMSRQPSMSDTEYTHMLSVIADMGYNREHVRRVPQQW